MKKLFGIFLMLLCLSSYSQDTTAANNAIKMGYNFVTVSQTVVFNSAMQAGGTLTFSANAMDGGGRAPGDPFTMKLVFYNSSNAVVNTVQQAYTLVYGSTTPTAYSITATNCGNSCAGVAYVSVQFYGKDGGYWAGNYGPYIINPSLTYNGGSNILYNPEFGVYGTNGYAQGWTSSNGWQSCALYSGAQTCVVNNGALVNGGNYSATGGTTSSTPGGYTVAASGPTVEGGTITQTNAPTSQTLLSGGGASIGPSTSETTRINTYNNSTKPYNNYVYVEQVSGDYNNVTVTQSGGPNRIEATLNGAGNNTLNLTQSGAGYLKSTVDGYNNNLTTNQSNTGGSHFAETSITGNTNTVNHTQTGNANQLLFSTISGNNNTVTSSQTGTAQHYLNVGLIGNGNSVISDQSGNTSNSATISLTNGGGAASVDLQQTGGKSFNLIQTCANASGCSTVVRQ